MRQSLSQGSRVLAARLLLAFAFALAMPLVAEAAAGRTFVASNGSDANSSSNCPVSAPCQTFAVAYGVTTVGGEIVAIDGAGYGPLTITNSIRIIALQRAFIKPTPGTTGVTISGGNVVLDNIEVNGAGGASTTGITVNGGHLVLRNSVLTQLTTGLVINGVKVDIVNSQIEFNTTGISTSGTGTDFSQGFVSGGFGPTQARIYNTTVFGNSTAFFMSNPGVASASGGTQSKITILTDGSNNRFIGNTTLVDGNGTGCPTGINAGAGQCNQINGFSSPTADNQTVP